MSALDFIWADEIVVHLAEHGLSQDDFESVVLHPVRRLLSRSTGLPACMGYTADGRYIIAA